MKHSGIARSLFAWVALTQCFSWVTAAQQPDAPRTSNGWRRIDESQNQVAFNGVQSSSPSRDLVLPAGTWITMRVNDPLSSDSNRNGDVFTGTLEKPLVVRGFVVARRGQTVEGRVDGVQRAGRVKGTSQMGIELTEISLVDGQQLPVRTQLIQYAGGTSNGNDATAIAASTGFGAMMGGAIDGGFGAGMGAIAGAAASTIGVLVTRGRPTVIYPEATLTFRTLAPLVIATDNSAHAFEPVTQTDYESTKHLQPRTVTQPTLYPSPNYGGVWGGWPYVYGPSVYVYASPWSYGFGWGGYGCCGYGWGYGYGWGGYGWARSSGWGHGYGHGGGHGYGGGYGGGNGHGDGHGRH